MNQPDISQFEEAYEVDPSEVMFSADARGIPTDHSDVERILGAIRQIESGGNYNVVAKDTGRGAYQFMPSTWQEESSKYARASGLGDAPLPMTPENQDAVARSMVTNYLAQGYSPKEIASIWNSGHSDWTGRVGVNKWGVKYDVPAHVAKFEKAYQNLGGSTTAPQRRYNMLLDALARLLSPSEAEAAEIPGADHSAGDITFDPQGRPWTDIVYSQPQSGGFPPEVLGAGLETGENFPFLVEEAQPEDVDFIDELAQSARNYAAFGGMFATSGIAAFSRTLANATEYVAKLTGTEPGGLFHEATKELESYAEYWREQIQNPSAVEEVVGGAVGGAIPGVTQFVMGIPYAAAQGYFEGGVRGMIKEVIRRATMGGLLKATGGLSMPSRAVATGWAFGAEAASRGASPGEIGKAAATGGLMAAAGGPGGKSAKQAFRDFKESLPERFRDETGAIVLPERSRKKGTAAGEPEIEFAREAYDNYEVPEGWYVHGRFGQRELRSDAPILMTKNWSVADHYAGREGSRWLIRPRENAKVLNLESQNSKDMDLIVKKALEDYHDGNLPYDKELKGRTDAEIGEEIRSAFAPEAIVESAQAYDNVDWHNWLVDRFEPDFIVTPDGALALNKNAVEAIRVPESFEPSSSPAEGEQVSSFQAAKKLLSDEGGFLAIGDMWDTVSKARDAFHDLITIDPIPRITRVDRTLADKTVEHASARIAPKFVVNKWLADVFPEDYGNPQVLEKFADVLNKDNILDGYDTFVARARDSHNQETGIIRASWDKVEQEIDRIYGKAQRAVQDNRMDQATAYLNRAKRLGKVLNQAKAKGYALGEEATLQAEAARWEAEKWTEFARRVTDKHDLMEYDKEVQTWLRDSRNREAVARWKSVVNSELDTLYNEAKRVDPNTPREGRGKHTGARINLLSKAKEAEWLEATKDERAFPSEGSGSSNYRNPNMKADAYDRHAQFTGDYSTNLEAILMNVYAPRWNEVTKSRLYNQIVDSGAGVWADGKTRPDKIGDKEAVWFPVDLRETNENGDTHTARKGMWVRSDLVEELRIALDTDLRIHRNPVLNGFTALQLAQIADAVTHSKNLHSCIVRAQGADAAWKDAIRKIPGIGTADAIARVFSVGREVLADTPAIRSEMAEMAKQGLLRPQYPPSGFQQVMHTQEFLHKMDTACRIIMNRFYNSMVERGLAVDNPHNRRQFINQVGQYNDRLMGKYMQSFKRMGLAPFIVAGRNFNRQGTRWITGNPGFETTGRPASARIYLMNAMGTVVLATIPMMLNAITNGTPFGRSGTPIGAWDPGIDEDEKGKHRVVDLFQMVGFRRGLKRLGLEALIEGAREGHDFNQIAGQAFMDIGRSAMHPWLGPGVSGAIKALSGYQLDVRGKFEAQKIPEGGILQQVENARAALESQNPLLYSMARPLLAAAGIDQKPEKPYMDELSKTFLKSPYSAFGIKDVYPGMSGAELMARNILQSGYAEGMTPDQQRTYEARQAVKGEFKDAGPTAITAAIAAGTITRAQGMRMLKDAQRTNLQNLVGRIDKAGDAVKVYHAATPEEREGIKGIVAKKINSGFKAGGIAKEEYQRLWNILKED